MSFKKKVAKLENLILQKPDKVLTMYLNTDRSDPDQQGGEWKIALKNGFNSFEQYLAASDEEEKKRLKTIREKVEAYIFEKERELPRSVIIFASASGVWEAFDVQIPISTQFYWEETPVLDQLKELYMNYPQTGLVLMQQNQVKIIETALGYLGDSEFFEYDMETEDWRIHAGPPPSSQMNGGKATQQDHFEDRVRVNQERWWKSLGSKLDKKAADGMWEKIILIGDKEEADVLENNMNKTITLKIQKNLLNEKEHKVLEEVLV